jgi:sRNA-binding carbon storage regulator CsrA
MLVLGRELGERVFIDVAGVRVVVSLEEIRDGRRARLGFAAPPEVRIVREELVTGGRDGGRA